MSHFEIIASIENIISKGFIVRKELLNAFYKETIGTYHLIALLKYHNGNPVGVYAYYIWNSRIGRIFKFDKNDLYLLNRKNEFVLSETIDGIPKNVFNKIFEICVEA